MNRSPYGAGRLAKECPLCGETMRVKTREFIDRIPGQPQLVRGEVREWICPDCDYYEDADIDRTPD